MQKIATAKLSDWIFATLREAAWSPISVFVFYLVARSLHLYELFPDMDIPTHLLGGVAIAYFCRVAIRHSQNVVGEIPYPVQVLLAITCTATVAIFWEFYENLFDLFFQTDMVRGVRDTVIDLLNGLLGALALSLFYRRR